MSGNENENVSQGNGEQAEHAGGAAYGSAGWGWEPVPQGGEYDSDATAFVSLPPDMLDALGTGEPLAAPGHGYVPPPMILPLGSATTDPAATGTWTIPAQWPEAGAPEQVAAPSPAPVGGPIPASIPIPAAVAAAFGAPGEPEAADAVQADPAAGPGLDPGFGLEPDPGATAEWRFDTEETGEFRRASAPEADWSQAPATLPGGAAAPWANHPGFEGALGYAAQPPAAAPAPAAPAAPAAGRLLGGPGVGTVGRGPRVLGGPGVGTLPEGEPVHPAPHDIDVSHGPAAAAVTAERPHPGAEPYGYAGQGPVGSGPVGSGPGTDGHGFAVPDPGPGTEGHGFALPVEGAAAEPGGSGPDATDGHGFAVPDAVGQEQGYAQPGSGPASGSGRYGAQPGEVRPEAVLDGAQPGDAEPEAAVHRPEPDAGADGVGTPPGEAADGDAAVSAPGGGGAGSGSDGPDAVAAEGLPAGVPTYEEETAPAVAHHEHPLASYVLRVNGADRPVTGAWIGESLLYVLRERLGLAGAKDGCSQGECGACAVQVDGRLVASCLVPAATAAGSEVRTVEGLAAGGELSDVQQALCRSGAVQCGFCVPGMAMTIHDLLEGNHAPSELETRQALCGNLCRCSGYKGVLEAVREVVAGRGATATATAGAAAAEQGTTGPAATAEPAAPLRIPHQAPPGEGGVHGHGTDGIQHNGGMA
jgi:aerobic-type carbon monoxide dehydrogenase small subunit (CoxS/CutS family)